MAEEPYVPLRVKSCFSFLEGASMPGELVGEAHRLGLPAVAVTDRDGVYGLVRAHVRAKELGVPLVLGSELTIGATDDAPRSHVVLLAGSRAGYGALTHLISKARLRSPKGSARATLDEVREAAGAGGLVALAWEPALLAPLREAYGDALYAGLARHLRAGDAEHERALREEAERVSVKTVVANDVLYHSPSRRALGDVLTCIRHGTTLSAAGSKLAPNGEHDLKAPAAMRALFADDLASLARTREVAERVRFSLGEIRYVYPAEKLPAGHSEQSFLRELTILGAHHRYGPAIPDAVTAQLERELSIIEDLEYGGYFLTMWEIVERCRAEKILCQGRGSAANSAVCFCLGITAVDPVKMDLLFERFLSRERAEPPDIDVDIEHERREEIIQWVYERYGRRHAAMVANVIRYRAKSAVRDVGKALGLSQTELDRLSKLLGWWGKVDDDLLVRAGLDPHTPAHRLLITLSQELLDFPRHLSIHPGGFLLGHEPVDTLVPIESATMEGRTVIQWDKEDVEALGLFKVDLLGLGALTVVHKCFGLIEQHHGVALDMARVPVEDLETYEMCSRGDTVGVFQIESRAQMAMLPRLRPRTFYDLVIEVAIVRPGPIQGDMVHPYLRRREGKEEATYPHPSLERVLKKTLGVPIFQEQVMKLAVLVAGYTPGEADQLRRDMAAWRSAGRIEQHHDRIVTRMVENGISVEFAERVFSQIRGFGEYGFPESHAASFALIAYVTAWMKAHYPAAFACGLLNAQPMGFYAPSTILEDVKRHGVTCLPIDATRSAKDCTLEWHGLADGAMEASAAGAGPHAALEDASPALRMGLRYVRGLHEADVERLLDARARRPFADLDDFVRRSRISSRATLSLAEAGALSALGVDRRDALWRARGLVRGTGDALPVSSERTDLRFRGLTRDEQVGWDYAASSHSVRGHPMARFRELLARRKVLAASAVSRLHDGALVDYVGFVICRQRPGTASGVTFFTLEDETGFVNLVVWTQIFEKYEVLAKTAGLMGVEGRIQSQHGVVHLIADRLYAPELTTPDARPRSRDFH